MMLMMLHPHLPWGGSNVKQQSERKYVIARNRGITRASDTEPPKKKSDLERD